MRNRFLVLVGLVLAIAVSLGIAPKPAHAQTAPAIAQPVVASDLGVTTFITSFDDGLNGTSKPFGSNVGTSAIAWVNNSTLPFWYAAASTGGGFVIDGAYASSSVPQLYAYHDSGSTNLYDYGLGSVSSDGSAQSKDIYVGWLLQNKTGGTITSMDVSCVGEQWRGNGLGTTDSLVFSYKIGTGLTGQALSDFQGGTGNSSEDFTSPVTNTVGFLDGNVNDSFRPTVTIPVTVPSNSYVLLSWLHAAQSGPSDGLALDDVKVKFSGVIPQDTTTSLSADAPSGATSYGTSVGFIAQVSTTSDHNPVPGTGTVTFTFDGVASSPIAVNASGKATLPQTLSAGTHTIAAAYNANIGYNGSTATSITNYAVTQATPTVSVTASSTSVTYGASIVYGATAVNPNGGGTAPTGTVTFSADPTNCTGLALGTGCTTTLTEAGAPTTVTATFTPDTASAANYVGGSNTKNITVAAASTSTVVSSVTGTPVTPTTTTTLQATVSNSAHAGGGVAPSGSVDFMRGATDLGTATVTNGVATKAFTADSSALPLGDDVITAIYTPSTNPTRYVTSTSGNFTESVYANTTVVVTGPSTSTYNDSVTFSANVTATNDATAVNNGVVTFTVTPGPYTQTGAVSGGTATSAPFTGLDAGTYQVTASYAHGTAARTYNDSVTAGNYQHVRAKAMTTTVVTSNHQPQEYGLTMDLTATVTTVSAGSPPDCTGCVTFYDGTSGLGVANLVSGKAVFTKTAPAGTAPWSLGDHSISAWYTASTDYATSMSATFTQSIAMAVSTVTPTVVTPAASLVYGSLDKFNVAVTSNANSGPVSGTVTLSVGALTSAPLQLVNGSVAFDTSVFSSFIPAGATTLTAAYSGDADHQPASASVNFTIAKATTSSVVGASPNPAYAGQTVTFSAAITGQLAGSPTGTLTFLDGGTSLGSVAVGNGSASLAISNLGVGPHSVSVQYSGDANFQPSLSAATSETISIAQTTTSILPSSNPVMPNTPVNFGVSVTPNAPATGMPTGTVTITSDGSPIATVTLAGGTGYFQAAGFTVGPHQIAAQYTGDGQFAPSTSDPTTLTAIATATTFSVTADPTSPYFGQAVTVTAKLTSSAGIPTGTVTLKDNGNAIGTSSLAGGSATFTATNLAVGTHALTVSYNGDGSRLAGSGSIAVVVRGRPTSTTLAQDSAQTAPGAAVTFTATVASDAGPVSDGFVVYTDGGVALGNPVSISGGSASLTTTSLTTGTHDIIAIFQASGGYDTSQSFSLQHAVVANPQTDGGVLTTPTPDAGSGAHPGTGSSSGDLPDGGDSVPDVDAGDIGLGSINVGNSSGGSSSCSSTQQPLSFGGAMLVGIVALFVSRRRRR